MLMMRSPIWGKETIGWGEGGGGGFTDGGYCPAGGAGQSADCGGTAEVTAGT